MAETAGAIRAGRAFVELLLKDSLTRPLDQASRKLHAFGESVTAIGAKVFAAGGSVVAGFGGALKVFAEAGSELFDLSRKTGVSVESLSSLGYAADRSGSSAEAVGHSFRHLAKFVQEAATGSAEANATLAELGLTAAQLQGLKPDEAFRRIGAQLGKIPDPSQRAAAAMAVFGRSGMELLPVFSEGADGLAKMEARARELGLVMSGGDAASAKEFSNSMKDLWAVLRQSAVSIGAALAPELKDLVAWLTRGAVKVLEFVKNNKGLIVTVATVAAGVTAAGAALVAAGGVIAGLGAVLGGLSAVLSVVGSVLAAVISPVGLVVAALAGIGGAVLYFTGAGGKALEWFKGQWAALAPTVLGTWQGIKDALAAGDLALAARVAWSGVKYAVLSNTVGIQQAWVNLSSDAQIIWAEIVAAAKMAFFTIGGYAAAEVLRWQAQWEKFQAFATASIESIVATFKPAIDVLSFLWENFVNGFMMAWRAAVLWVTKIQAPLLRAGAKLGIAGAKEALAMGAVQQATGFNPVHLQRASEIGAEGRQQAQEELEREKARIEADRDRRIAGIDEGVERARQEMQLAQQEAAEAAEAARQKAMEKIQGPGGLPEPGAVAQQLQSKVDVKGTFSALAAGQIGSDKVQDRIADNTHNMLEQQKKTNRLLQGGIAPVAT